MALSGRLKPETTRQASNRPHRTTDKITDWDKFAQFAKTHGDKTQAQMAALWGGISARTISRALHKLGLSRKKRRTATANGMKRSRAAFLEQLAEIPYSQRVYVDESGMDERFGLWLRLV